MSDPYVWPGSACLRNKLGIEDPTDLASAEFRIVSVRDVEAARQTIPGEYNLEHLRSFHRHLFRDIYDWAGDTRTVDISKSGVMFCHFRFVDNEIGSVLDGLQREEYLIGLNLGPFVERLAYYYAEINVVHPFREGNGRTQRAFLRQLAAAAGWHVDWSDLDRTENIKACQVSVQTKHTTQLVDLLKPLLTKL